MPPKPKSDKPRVPCMACVDAGKSIDDPNIQFISLGRHLKDHVLSLNDYRTKYPGADTGWSIGTVRAEKAAAGLPAPSRPPNQNTWAVGSGPLAKIKQNLTQEESEQFDERFAILFEQADEDPALRGPVQDIVLNEIYISRYQAQLAKLSKGNANEFSTQASAIKNLNTIIKDATKQNLDLMGSLSLTRRQKRAENKTVDSTPVKLMTAYYNFHKNLTPDLLKRENQEEEEAVKRLHRNLRENLKLVPEDAAPSDGF